MATVSFNPYRDWLGISDDGTSLDHYRLLGLSALENNPQTIARAADEVMAKVRAIRPGENAGAWSKLLDEIRTAKNCLSNLVLKAEYDLALRTTTTNGPQLSPAPVFPTAAPGPMFPAAAMAVASPVLPTSPAATIPTGPVFPLPVGPQYAQAQPPYPQPVQPTYPQQAQPIFPQQQFPQPAAPYQPGYAPQQTELPQGYPQQPFPQPQYPQPAFPQPQYPPLQYPQAVYPQPGLPAVQYGAYPAAPTGGDSHGFADLFKSQETGPMPWDEMPGAQPVVPVAQAIPVAPTIPDPMAPVAMSFPGGVPISSGPSMVALGGFPIPAAQAAQGFGTTYAPASVATSAAQGDLLHELGSPASRSRRIVRAKGKDNSLTFIAIGGVALLLIATAVAVPAYLNKDKADDPNAVAHHAGGDKHLPPGTENKHKPEPKHEPDPADTTHPEHKPDLNNPDVPKPETKPEPVVPKPKPEPVMPKPEPEVKPEPKPEPVTPKPKPEPKPEAKPDPQQIEKFNKLVAAMKTSLGSRDLAAAKKQTAELHKLAVSQEQIDTAEHMELLREYVNGYWEAVKKAMAGLKPTDTIEISSSTQLVIVESGPGFIATKLGPTVKRYTVENMPKGLANTIANQWFDKKPQNKLFIGAFLAVDPQGSPAEAKQVWEDAAKAGADAAPLLALLNNVLK